MKRGSVARTPRSMASVMECWSSLLADMLVFVVDVDKFSLGMRRSLPQPHQRPGPERPDSSEDVADRNARRCCSTQEDGWWFCCEARRKNWLGLMHNGRPHKTHKCFGRLKQTGGHATERGAFVLSLAVRS